MGGAKRQWMEDAESGLNAGAMVGKFVCAECFTDSSIQRVVEGAIASDVCTFCGAQSDEGIAAPLETVMQHVVQCLRLHYDDPANCLPHDSAEGGYQVGVTFDSWEVLDEVGMGDCLSEERDGLLDAIRSSLQDAEWCQRDPFDLHEHEKLSFSWEQFRELVKHERRFFLLGVRPPYSERDGADRLLAPAEMLQTLLEYCRSLVVPLATGTVLFRARQQQPGNSPYATPLELGPPPAEHAKQNRLSPAGIVMAYFAEDESTALAETIPSKGTLPGTAFAVGEFQLTKELCVLDFASAPRVPSIFDRSRVSEIDPALFLQEFLRDFAKAIEPDDRVHIDYVPTQVVTEYLRWSTELRALGVRGLRYRSAQGNGICVVIFGGRELLVLSNDTDAELRADACLRLVGSHQHVTS